MAYGGNATLAALRDRLPVTTRFLPHGHKIGFGLVAARGARRAAGAGGSRGSPPMTSRATSSRAATRRRCSSSSAAARCQPRRLRPASGGRSWRRSHGRHPRRALSLAEAAAIAGWRDAEEMRATGGAGPDSVSSARTLAGASSYADAAERPAPPRR